MSSRKVRKLYVHFEDRGTCLLHNVEDESAIGDVFELFLKACTFISDVNLHRRDLQALTAKGRPLNPSQSVKKAIGKDVDIYLRLDSDRLRRISGDAQGTAKSDVASSTTNGDQLCSGQGHALSARSEQGPAVQGNHRRIQSPLIAPLLQKAAEKETSQHYKAAAFIYKQVRQPSAK